MTLSPLLRNIHKNKVTVVRWEDKQGNRSTSTYCSDNIFSAVLSYNYITFLKYYDNFQQLKSSIF